MAVVFPVTINVFAPVVPVVVNGNTCALVNIIGLVVVTEFEVLFTEPDTFVAITVTIVVIEAVDDSVIVVGLILDVFEIVPVESEYV